MLDNINEEFDQDFYIINEVLNKNYWWESDMSQLRYNCQLHSQLHVNFTLTCHLLIPTSVYLYSHICEEVYPVLFLSIYHLSSETQICLKRKGKV